MNKIQTTAYSVPAAVPGERADCSVRALMVAACVDYATAHAAFAAAGRKRGKSTSWGQSDQVIHALVPTASAWNDDWRRTGPFTFASRRTLAQWLLEHGRGHYVVHVSGHALAVVDGVVHDWGHKGLRRRVRGFWKLV